MAQIFLSYGREDLELARQLIESFERRGWSVFWDQGIRTGTTWLESIGDELQKASVVVVLWSSTSVTRKWVLEEAHLANARSALFPISVDGTSPPIGFTLVQTAQLAFRDATPDAQALEGICVDLAHKLQLPPLPPHPHPHRPPPPTKPTALGVRRAWPGALLLLVVAFATAIAVYGPERGASAPLVLLLPLHEVTRSTWPENLAETLAADGFEATWRDDGKRSFEDVLLATGVSADELEPGSVGLVIYWGTYEQHARELGRTLSDARSGSVVSVAKADPSQALTFAEPPTERSGTPLVLVYLE